MDAPAPAGGIPAKERRIPGMPLLQGVLPIGPEGVEPDKGKGGRLVFATVDPAVQDELDRVTAAVGGERFYPVVEGVLAAFRTDG